MGIKGLTKLISEQAPDAMKESALESFVGRKVAFDASMHIYQFLAVVGRSGDQVLTNEAGEVTAHLQGLFHRTIRIVEAGIKPIFVFDGKPPELKSAEIAERREKREEADKALAAAKEAGDAAEVEKLSKRTIKVTKDQNEDCKKLLRLMGIPVLEVRLCSSFSCCCSFFPPISPSVIPLCLFVFSLCVCMCTCVCACSDNLLGTYSAMHICPIYVCIYGDGDTMP